MRREYCTYFDHRYAPRGIAMIRSLRRHEPDARVWVLCMSDEAYRLFDMLKEPGVVPIQLAEFERDDIALAAARNDGRTRIEYYFTCTPSLIRYVMRAVPDAEWVTYLDGDLWFFNAPDCIYDEIGDASVAIIPHRYPPGHEAKHKYGLYNVGWVSFRRTSDGTECLNWWRERCNEWCLDIVDEVNDRFADQRYLNQFPKIFSGVRILQNTGLNLAPWNIGGHQLALDGKDVAVDGQRLVFFHFHGLKRFGTRHFLPAHGQYGAGLNPVTRQYIYKPYLRELIAIEQQTEPMTPTSGGEPVRQGAPRAGSNLAKVRTLRNYARWMRAFVSGHLIRV